MFSYLSPEERVPEKHPLRPIRLIVDEALKGLSPAFAGSPRRTPTRDWRARAAGMKRSWLTAAT